MNYAILNLIGQEIDSGLLIGNTINRVNIENAAAGIYLLRVNSNNMIYTQKFVKE